MLRLLRRSLKSESAVIYFKKNTTELRTEAVKSCTRSQVRSGQRVYLKGEPGPAGVVGRPCGSLFFAYISPQEKFKNDVKGV